MLLFALILLKDQNVSLSQTDINAAFFMTKVFEQSERSKHLLEFIIIEHLAYIESPHLLHLKEKLV